jgi:hypothetical protein
MDDGSTKIDVVSSIAEQRALTSQQLDNNFERQPRVRQVEPSKEQEEEIIQSLDMEEQHSNNVVFRLPQPEEVHERVGTRGKRPIQPTTTLRYEFVDVFRDIRLGFRCLNVCESPLCAGLGHELETQDTIFCKEHILLEDVHALDTFLAKPVRESVIPMEVLVQWPSKDSLVSVRRERTRQHRHVSERRLKWLVKNIGDLVLEILGRDKRIQQFLATFAQHSMNLTAGTPEVLIIVKREPELQDTVGSRAGSRIEQDANFGLQDFSKRRE